MGLRRTIERLGRSADEISAEYGLGLVDICAALACCYDHQAESDRTIRQQEDFVATLKRYTPSRPAVQRLIATHG